MRSGGEAGVEGGEWSFDGLALKAGGAARDEKVVDFCMFFRHKCVRDWEL
jgi:hypothetical protein